MRINLFDWRLLISNNRYCDQEGRIAIEISALGGPFKNCLPLFDSNKCKEIVAYNNLHNNFAGLCVSLNREEEARNLKIWGRIFTRVHKISTTIDKDFFLIIETKNDIDAWWIKPIKDFSADSVEVGTNNSVFYNIVLPNERCFWKPKMFNT